MIRFLLILFLLIPYSSVSANRVEIVFWYSLAGHLGHELNELIEEFNHSQQDFVIKPVYKGEYIDSFTSFAAAFRAKKPPALIQVFEVGTASMLNPKGIIKPIAEILAENNLQLPTQSFLPVVREYYSKADKLQALPFNISIPVMFYNADALQKIGYTSDNFPKSWDEMEILAEKLKKNGNTCVYSTAYPGWIQVESFSALHGLAMTSSTGKAIYNTKALTHHFERLKRWQNQHYFEYGGRTSDATILFTSGRCVIFSQSSGSYKSLSQMVDFQVGVAALPIDTKASRIRYSNIAGGAAIWAVAGQSKKVYQGIARFLVFWTQAKIQKRWHEQTGYLPIGLAGVYESIIDKNNPIVTLARDELASTRQRKGPLYLGPQNQIRSINDEAIEAIFAGTKTPKRAMKDAIARANYILLRFTRNTAL